MNVFYLYKSLWHYLIMDYMDYLKYAIIFILGSAFIHYIAAPAFAWLAYQNM